MKLTIRDRMELFNLINISIPQESFAGLKTIRSTKECLTLSSDELEKFKLKPDEQGQVTIPNRADVNSHLVDVPIDHWLHTRISGILLEKDRNRQLRESEMRLFELFVEDYRAL